MGEDDEMKDKKSGRGMETATPGVNGCCQGGAETSGTLTPEGTAVSLTAFKNVYLGVAAGESFKFPTLAGTDQSGRTWSGSYSLLADGARSFEGHYLTRSREVVTLKVAGGIPVISMSTKYFELGEGGIYKIVFNTGVTYRPVSQGGLPSSLKVGDTGTLGTFAGSDTTTVTVTWELKPALNGSSLLEVSSVVSGPTETATEVDSYLLDETGIPRTVTLSATAMDTTVVLSGKKKKSLD